MDKEREEQLKEEAKQDLPDLNDLYDGLEIYTHQQLRDYVPEPQPWLIENIIPKGEVGLFVARAGERKTFLSLYLALCLASGKKVFGINEVPESKKVLFLDEETGKRELSKRIKALEKGLGIQNQSLNIKYAPLNSLKIDRDKTKFFQILEDYKPDLIIVDCLSRVVNFEVDKDNASISEFFTGVVREAIKKYGCSWLFIHHLRKPKDRIPLDDLDEIRGGSELRNYCRYILGAQLPKNQESKENIELVIFRVLKMSNAPIIEPMVISFENSGDSTIISYVGIPKEVLSMEVRCATAIKEYLFAKQIAEFHTKELLEVSEEIGAKRTLLSYGLNLLQKQGYLEKVKRGVWKVRENSQK